MSTRWFLVPLIVLSCNVLRAVDFDAVSVAPTALVSTGDLTRIQGVMAKAERGEKITVAVIGGSITAGAKATTAEKRYGNLIADGWRKAYPKADIAFVNAGIGATGSNFGALRAQRDLLAHHPDFVVVEYSVNDGNTQAAAETLEGLIRQILKQPNAPAVVQLFMMHRGGGNAQEWHSKVGRYYALPMVSYRDALWPEIQAKRIGWETVMADEVHPNDTGHACAAAFVNHWLDIARVAPRSTAAVQPLPAPLFGDLYEHTALLEAPDLHPLSNTGWTLDATTKSWRSEKPGSVIEFAIDGTAVFTMHYVVKRPMGKAKVQIDGGAPVVYDAWFNQTWGGYRSTNLLAKDLKPGKHTVRVELLDEKNPGSDGHEFRILGLGAAGVSTP
jgi:lysophospholipase L1-like esterase